MVRRFPGVWVRKSFGVSEVAKDVVYVVCFFLLTVYRSTVDYCYFDIIGVDYYILLMILKGVGLQAVVLLIGLMVSLSVCRWCLRLLTGRAGLTMATRVALRLPGRRGLSRLLARCCSQRCLPRGIQRVP